MLLGLCGPGRFTATWVVIVGRSVSCAFFVLLPYRVGRFSPNLLVVVCCVHLFCVAVAQSLGTSCCSVWIALSVIWFSSRRMCMSFVDLLCVRLDFLQMSLMMTTFPLFPVRPPLPHALPRETGAPSVSSPHTCTLDLLSPLFYQNRRRPDGTETVKVSYSLRRQDLVRLDARSGKKQIALSKVCRERPLVEQRLLVFGSSVPAL